MLNKSILRPIKIVVEKALKIQIIKKKPRGLDFICDTKSIITPKIIFDIGANIGQTAIIYNSQFNNAEIFCFEPAESNFNALKKNTWHSKNIHPIHNAVGSQSGTVKLFHSHDPTMHHLKKSPIDETDERSSELVELITLDEFCKKNEIEFIDLLKVDTEGHDLEVLKGAEDLLTRQRISVIYTETGMSPKNSRHAPFEEIKDFMEKHGYLIFGIYEQTHEWIERKPFLRRVNVAYISPIIAEKTYHL